MAYDIIIEKPYMTVTYEYPDFGITMEAFLCTAVSQHFTLREHHAFQWLSPSRLGELDWAAADQPIAERLSQEP